MDQNIGADTALLVDDFQGTPAKHGQLGLLAQGRGDLAQQQQDEQPEVQEAEPDREALDSRKEQKPAAPQAGPA